MCANQVWNIKTVGMYVCILHVDDDRESSLREKTRHFKLITLRNNI
jgi:hypothetical protein